MKRIYSSIDIGTDTIKLVVCELYNNRLNLLAASSVKSKGIKKGLIVNPNEATISIKKVFDDVEAMLGIKIKQVIASIPSYFAEFNIIKGKININEEEIITGNEIVEVLDNAMGSRNEVNREMVNILPIDFTLDGKTGIKDPKGLKGNILEVRAIMATAPSKMVYSIVGILNNLGIDIVDISFGSVGDIYTFNNSSLQDKIGCVINIGHETTTISLYNKGTIVKSSIICMGSKNITNDLAYMYKIDIDQAEKVKQKLALAHKKYASSSEYMDIVSNEYDSIMRINQLEASEVVMARINEILELSNKEINSLTSHEIEYIIITGGISNMPHFEYCIDDYFKNVAFIGNITIMGIRNNKYSSALGNILYFISKLELKGVKATMVEKQTSDEIGIPTKNGISISRESMIGKVFGYFFGQ